MTAAGSTPDDSNFALADFNIPFWYLKEDLKLSSEVTPNLKWADFKNDKRLERRTRAFQKQLLMMIRNKVLLEGGDLAGHGDRVVLSVEHAVVPAAVLSELVGDLLSAVLPRREQTIPDVGKLCAFYHYYHKENVRPHDRPAVNIDIGGGTTDIVIYQSEGPDCVDLL